MHDDLKYRPFSRSDEGVIWLLATGAEYEQFISLSPFRCEHPKSELRDYETSNGGWQRKEQCLSCGRSASNAKKRVAGDGTPLWDPSIEMEYNAALDDAREELLQVLIDRTADQEGDGYVAYEEYLETEEWKKRRGLVLVRDQGRCQACFQAPATEVHHLTYDRIFKEPLFDLVAVCRPCHEQLHERKLLARAAAEAKPKA